MAFAPVRIRRETRQIGKSSIHWHEKVTYQVIFSRECNENDVRDAITLMLESKIMKYEKEIYGLKSRYFESDTNSKSCIVGLSGRLNCADFNGGSCLACTFNTTIVQLEVRVQGLKREQP